MFVSYIIAMNFHYLVNHYYQFPFPKLLQLECFYLLSFIIKIFVFYRKDFKTFYKVSTLLLYHDFIAVLEIEIKWVFFLNIRLFACFIYVFLYSFYFWQLCTKWRGVETMSIIAGTIRTVLLHSHINLILTFAYTRVYTYGIYVFKINCKLCANYPTMDIFMKQITNHIS